MLQECCTKGTLIGAPLSNGRGNLGPPLANSSPRPYAVRGA